MFIWANPNVIDQITIEPKLYKRQNKWALVLEECWPFPNDPIGDSTKLDERINWCADKLKDWPGCTRMAYDQFWFKNKVEAEKFITVYTLTWR
jgi:hypothetical protein